MKTNKILYIDYMNDDQFYDWFKNLDNYRLDKYQEMINKVKRERDIKDEDLSFDDLVFGPPFK